MYRHGAAAMVRRAVARRGAVGAPRRVGKLSTDATTAAPKRSVTPPPPPPTGGGSNFMPVAIALATAGGAYYFWDDLADKLGYGAAKVGDTGMTAGKLKEEVEALGAKIEAEEAMEAHRREREAVQAEADRAKREQEAQSQAQQQSKPQAESTSGDDDAASKKPLGPGIAATPGKVDYAAVREAIAEILDEEDYDDGSIGPLLVRLAWHGAGTYDASTKRGGSEGACMRFDRHEAKWGANAGLHEARARLEPIKARFPGITYSDLWSLAGTVALEEMGMPDCKWRPGRKDFDASGDTLPDGLLPDADGRGKENVADHLRDIFGRMGFNDKEIVCLSGAHVLGRCHTDRSGYWGPWSRSPTTFSNQYFKLLVEETWAKKTSHEGKPWNGPMQYENSESGCDLMMLPSDMALVQDEAMRPHVIAYAEDEQLFLDDFAKAWTKLQELGVRRFHGQRRYWLFGPRE